ncbi:MAG: DUF4190 domain-containing protein [Oscillospiraceae bacterium]|nr:DUF4190 domain-containing protein [Oscillospiraceae bacterium]
MDQENLNQSSSEQNTAETVSQNASEPQRHSSSGFAVASLVLGLVSLIGICCCAGLIDFITVPLALIFGIVSLVKKRSGTGLAITGIITGTVSLLIIATMLYVIWPLMPYAEEIVDDYSRLTREQDTVFPAYEETGELPDYLQKYTEAPFSDFFARYDGTIYTIMDALLEQYKSRGSLPFEISTWIGGDSSGASSEELESLTEATTTAGFAGGRILIYAY